MRLTLTLPGGQVIDRHVSLRSQGEAIALARGVAEGQQAHLAPLLALSRPWDATKVQDRPVTCHRGHRAGQATINPYNQHVRIHAKKEDMMGMISAKIPDALIEAATATAKAGGISRSELIRIALEAEIRRRAESADADLRRNARDLVAAVAEMKKAVEAMGEV